LGWNPPPVTERFMSKIDFSSSAKGCWIWKGSFAGHDEPKHAYGRFYFMGRNVMAHKFSYEFIGGYEIKKGYVIDHLCRTPSCVNPNHLQCITAKENTHRSNNPMATNLRKTECIRGHPLYGKNLYIAKDGHRRCLSCVRLRTLQFRKTGSYSIP